MKIKFDQHRECTGCTHADDIDPESDEPPELDWTPRNSDEEGPPGIAAPLPGQNTVAMSVRDGISPGPFQHGIVDLCLESPGQNTVAMAVRDGISSGR